MKVNGMRIFLLVLFSSALFAHPYMKGTQDPGTNPDNTSLSARHIIVLQADMKNIWGSYFFSIMNPKTTPDTVRLPLLVPKEMVDFHPEQGIKSEEIELGKDGKLFLNKEFPPGETLVSLGFKTDTAAASNYLTFFLGQGIEQLVVLTTEHSGIQVLSPPNFTTEIPASLATGRYRGIVNKEPLKEGTELEIELSGFPETRTPYFFLVGLFAFLLFITAALGTLRTKSILEEKP